MNIKVMVLLVAYYVTVLPSYALAEGDKREDLPPKKEKVESWSIETEIDAYYTNLGLYLNLTDEPIFDAGDMKERAVYEKLFYSSLKPKFFVVEAAIFPMPVLGSIIKRSYEDFYDRAKVSRRLNIVKAVTAGFEEPYAVNFFLGNVIKFSKPGAKKEDGNFGYMGFLLSVGDYHIKDNELFEDNWAEIEWKVKGDRKFNEKKLSWSYRVGTKLHDNNDIKDVYYLGIRRSQLDYTPSAKGIMDNSGIEYRYDMDAKTLQPIRHLFFVDKKFPWTVKKMAVSLALGFIWEGQEKYRGELSGERKGSDFQIIIRPNIHF